MCWFVVDVVVGGLLVVVVFGWSLFVIFCALFNTRGCEGLLLVGGVCCRCILLLLLCVVVVVCCYLLAVC